LRLGAIWGGANTPGGKQPPQQERLYAGGASSVRGFQQNELGALLYVFDDSIRVQHVSLPRSPGQDSTEYFTYSDTGLVPRRVVPVGGNTLFVTSLDYRVRSPFLPDVLQFSVFADVGTVWNRNTITSTGGFTPRWTPGVSARIFSPLGPIQVNAGYNPYEPVLGPALYTPLRALATQGYTGVYCAVPKGTPVSPQIPLSHLQPDGTWKQDTNVECPNTYRQKQAKTFVGRLNFTFSIGTEF
jgi:outer membrane protein insertion porin family/translocation and assembly module TamA